METYAIYFRFRGEEVKALVHDYAAHQLVYFTDKIILDDFTGCFEFENKKYVQGFIRNKDAKDLPTLIMAIERQLR